MTYATSKAAWTAVAEKVVLDATARDLRHFSPRPSIAGGASVRQVTVVGHSSAAITLRTYADLWPGDDARTRDVMDAALTPLADAVQTEAVSNGSTSRSDACERQESFLVSQKMSAISSILASSSSAVASSKLPFVPDAPASFVASLKSVWRCGYFSKCGGLK